MHGILGLSIFVPAIHGVMFHGCAVQNERMSLICFMELGILNGTGTAIYTARIPKRWYPRQFDVWLQSSDYACFGYLWCIFTYNRTGKGIRLLAGLTGKGGKRLPSSLNVRATEIGGIEIEAQQGHARLTLEDPV